MVKKLHEQLNQGLLDLSSLLLQSASAMVQQSLEQEREAFLNRSWAQRTPQACGYANGYEDKTVATAEGPMELRIPQVRGTDEPFRIFAHRITNLERLLTRNTPLNSGHGLPPQDSRPMWLAKPSLCGTSLQWQGHPLPYAGFNRRFHSVPISLRRKGIEQKLTHATYRNYRNSVPTALFRMRKGPVPGPLNPTGKCLPLPPRISFPSSLAPQGA